MMDGIKFYFFLFILLDTSLLSRPSLSIPRCSFVKPGHLIRLLGFRYLFSSERKKKRCKEPTLFYFFFFV